jgi:hypothetical protein
VGTDVEASELVVVRRSCRPVGGASFRASRRRLRFTIDNSIGSDTLRTGGERDGCGFERASAKRMEGRSYEKYMCHHSFTDSLSCSMEAGLIYPLVGPR